MPLDTSTYSLALLRIDGRRWNDLRRLHAQIHTQDAADGSSYLEMGHTKVMCVVTGPAEPQAGQQKRGTGGGGQAGGQKDGASIVVNVVVAGFSSVDRKRRGRNDRRIQEMEITIQKALAANLHVHLFPHSTITVSLHVLSQDGSLLAALINATTLALIDAGIPMTDYITACTAGSTTESKTTAQLLEEISQEAIAKTISAGASPASVEIVEKETLPLQYIAHKTRFIVRAAGDFDLGRVQVHAAPEADDEGNDTDMSQYEKLSKRPESTSKEQIDKDIDIALYKPTVKNRVWYISETDADWIATGCYILGTGGGGSPYSHLIRLKQELRKGAIVRVINPHDLADEDQIGCGGGVGSPTVGIEKLPADELLEAQHELFKVCPKPATHMISIEIGGGNGLQAMILGASTNMDLPAVDGDWMGRAYPTKWQTTPVVFNERSPIWSPIAMSDGNGNVVVMPKATSDLAVERILRAALTQMGSHTGCAESPVTGAETKRWVVEHTISQAWRIGRGVARARKENRVDNVAESIIEECGGKAAGKVLWKGKIVGVERTLRGGYVYGECFIEGVDVRQDSDGLQQDVTNPSSFRGTIKIPFKNENIAALKVRDDRREEQQEDVLAIAPDLITVIDAQNGEAIGTPEYRYGLLVVVLGLAASDKWTGSQRGIELGGPVGFGIDHLKFTPLGAFVKPRSVIDEFDGIVE